MSPKKTIRLLAWTTAWVLVIAACYWAVSSTLDRDIQLALKETKQLVGKLKEDVVKQLGQSTLSASYPGEFEKAAEDLRPSYGVIKGYDSAASLEIYSFKSARVVVFYSATNVVLRVDVYGS